MKRAIIRWAARFYERDRGRLLNLIGIGVLSPIKMIYQRDANKYRQLADNYDIDKGRVDLIINMISDRL